MDMKFKAGEIVQLKSGGPAMTVSHMDTSDRYVCVWFKGASKELSTFMEEALQAYVPPQK